MVKSLIAGEVGKIPYALEMMPGGDKGFLVNRR
jgi:hypothetical protein